MTKMKFCGLTRPCDIQAANALGPAYIGFVFAPGSRRRIDPETARALKALLNPRIQTVGVFVDEKPQVIAELANSGLIDLIQLHGCEDETYIRQLRAYTDRPVIQAFRIRTAQDIRAAGATTADYLLLDAGAGTGKVFDWQLLGEMQRPYFLAGGLGPGNVSAAIRMLHPYGVDVSSGIETDGAKDLEKMAAFAAAVRKEDEP